jgi:hypothetical protein
LNQPDTEYSYAKTGSLFSTAEAASNALSFPLNSNSWRFEIYLSHVAYVN